MGTRDRLWVKLSCDLCGEEGSAVVDKDSQLSGLRWENLGSLSLFDVAVRRGGDWRPGAISAMCRNCGAVASVETAYGVGRTLGRE